MPSAVAKLVARSAVFSRFVSLLARCDQGRDNHLQVLTYHRIDEPDRRPDLSPSHISATPEMFARQMAYVAKHHHAVSAADVLSALRAEVRLPRKAVLVTFDDAYCDFQEHAWPVLQRYAMPATMFVPTAYPDRSQHAFWWDRLYLAVMQAPLATLADLPCPPPASDTTCQRRALYARLISRVKSWPHADAMQFVAGVEAAAKVVAQSYVLDWNQLRRLAAEGLTLGGHTQTHPLLSRVSAETAAREIAGSLSDLRREIGDVLPILAYPGGNFNPATIVAVRAAGIQAAFANCRGVNNLSDCDPLRIRRNNIGLGTTDDVFRARLLTWSRCLNRWRPVNGC